MRGGKNGDLYPFWDLGKSKVGFESLYCLRLPLQLRHDLGTRNWYSRHLCSPSPNLNVLGHANQSTSLELAASPARLDSITARMNWQTLTDGLFIAIR